MGFLLYKKIFFFFPWLKAEKMKRIFNINLTRLQILASLYLLAMGER